MLDLQGQYQGRWWLPDEPATVQGGVLSFERADFGGTLRLTGSLPPRREGTRKFSQYDLVFGRSVDNEPITLAQCYEESFQGALHDPTHRFQELAARTVLVGAHIKDRPPRIDSLQFELPYLRAWAYDSDPTRISADLTDDAFTITYLRRPPEKAVLDKGRTLSLHRDFQYESRGGTARLVDRSYFQVDFAEPTTLDDAFADVVLVVQHLLTFATMRVNTPRGAVVTHRDAVTSGPSPIPIAIVAARPEVEKPPLREPEPTIPQHLLFALPRAPLTYQKLVIRWFELAPKLGAVLDLYLNFLYAPPRHLENQFMNMCQAAEGYHRVMWDYTIMPVEDLRGLRHILLEACPDRWKEWLRSILSHANEPSFKRRIDDLVAKAGKAVQPLLDTRPRYVQLMRDRRNDYAHWLRTATPTTAVIEQLFDLTRTTRFVLAACLLRDLGWGEEDAAVTIGRNRDFQVAVAEGQPDTHGFIWPEEE